MPVRGSILNTIWLGAGAPVAAGDERQPRRVLEDEPHLGLR